VARRRREKNSDGSRPAHSGLGSRLEQLLRLTEEQRDLMITEARQEAARIVADARSQAAEILANSSYRSTMDRARAFVQQGGGCRATFFNYRRRLGAVLVVRGEGDLRGGDAVAAAADGHVVLAVNKIHNPVPKRRMLVHYQDSRFCKVRLPNDRGRCF